MRDFDEITAFLGEWGPYQQLVFFLLIASVLPNGMNNMWMVFIAATPHHRCLIPTHLNISEAWMNRTIPVEVGTLQYSKCRRYRLDVIKNISENFPNGEIDMSTVEQEHCLDGWEYDRDPYLSTIVSEWDLVCDDDWQGPFSSSMFFLGMLVGSLLCGQASDRFGRKIVLFGSMVIQIVFNIILSFSPNWEVFSLFNFLGGAGHSANYLTTFVLGSELLGKSTRIIYSTLGICSAYAIGYMLLPLFAFFLRGWRILLLVLSVPGAIFLSLWWFIPESPRWLLSKGRAQEAEAIIRLIAKKNGVTSPTVLFSEVELEEMKAKNVKSYTVIHLIKSRKIRYITLINLILWMIIALGYFGLSLNTPNLHGDVYLNCFISAAIEIPATVAIWLFLWKLPRSFTIAAILLLGGIILLFIQLIPSKLSILVTVMVMIGKFCFACAFNMVFVYSSEFYPTVLRNTGVGTSSMAARATSILAPYFVYLGAFDEFLPFNVMGSLGILAGILTLFLPETLNVPLPDTIEDMQHIKGLKFWIYKKQNLSNQVEKLGKDNIAAITEEY
ncbi:solute carrier family 22 member 5 [Callorhinchus milii]|uniref:Solute carrier family 22 (Organic cation/carnitine transporter), member 5 n=1 Tax=Callorhinchus milii TaxID=7868 RepID=V9KFT2_CALMI|nr:solute carrier family 22 member 5 [Callorhinchus milii]|eukprot:gi/632966502/ref/XP_007899456.1/ PREDICTED: solute carrier family 22 member 5-like [Callorhinchus milii]